MAEDFLGGLIEFCVKNNRIMENFLEFIQNLDVVEMMRHLDRKKLKKLLKKYNKSVV